MNDVQTSVPATLVSPDSAAKARRRAPATVHTCLVVSSCAHRARAWMLAAQEEQWTTIVCSTAAEAIRQSVRQRVQLALVDLQSAPLAQERMLRTLIEQLASRDGPLLAVCGKPEDPTGEVWSRQLGVWMYLPGVDSQSDIALLCAEARNILQKLERHAAQASR